MEELKDLREKIDAIDQQMVDLFKQRMEVSKEVAAYKRANGLPTLDAGRERALLGIVFVMFTLHSTFDPQLVWIGYNSFIMAYSYINGIERKKGYGDPTAKCAASIT